MELSVPFCVYLYRSKYFCLYVEHPPTTQKKKRDDGCSNVLFKRVTLSQDIRMLSI